MAAMTDGSDYQVVVDGKHLMVSELTREQAIQEVCRLIDIIEDVQGSAFLINERIETWRTR